MWQACIFFNLSETLISTPILHYYFRKEINKFIEKISIKFRPNHMSGQTERSPSVLYSWTRFSSTRISIFTHLSFTSLLKTKMATHTLWALWGHGRDKLSLTTKGNGEGASAASADALGVGHEMVSVLKFTGIYGKLFKKSKKNKTQNTNSLLFLIAEK